MSRFLYLVFELRNSGPSVVCCAGEAALRIFISCEQFGFSLSGTSISSLSSFLGLQLLGFFQESTFVFEFFEHSSSLLKSVF